MLRKLFCCFFSTENQEERDVELLPTEQTDDENSLESPFFDLSTLPPSENPRTNSDNLYKNECKQQKPLQWFDYIHDWPNEEGLTKTHSDTKLKGYYPHSKEEINTFLLRTSNSRPHCVVLSIIEESPPNDKNRYTIKEYLFSVNTETNKWTLYSENKKAVYYNEESIEELFKIAPIDNLLSAIRDLKKYERYFSVKTHIIFPEENEKYSLQETRPSSSDSLSF